MDERTISAAEVTTAQELERARVRMMRSRTYVVIVLGRNNNKPFSIEAKATEDMTIAEDRSAKMTAAGVRLLRDDWAAGHLDDRRDPQICGNNDEAKSLVLKHLRQR